MSARGLHKLMGSTFQHVKPGLCEVCALRRPHNDGFTEWEGYCTARNKILSFVEARPNSRPRCADFQLIDDDDKIDECIATSKALAADVAIWE